MSTTRSSFKKTISKNDQILLNMSNDEKKKVCDGCKAKTAAKDKILICTNNNCRRLYHLECTNKRITRPEFNEIKITNIWYCSKDCERCKDEDQGDDEENDSESDELNSTVLLSGSENPSNQNILAAIMEVQKSQVFMSAQFDSFLKTQTILIEENKELKLNINNAKKHTEYLHGKVNQLEKDLLELKQAKLDNQIIITGVPKKKDEQLTKIIEKIGQVLETEIKAEHITTCRRIPSKHIGTEESIEPILVNFANNDYIKQQLMDKQKEKGQVITEQLGLDLQQNEKRKIFIRDYLADNTMNLFNMAKKELKQQMNFKYVWFSTITKKILARKGDKTKVFKIECEDDVKKIAYIFTSKQNESCSEAED